MTLGMFLLIFGLSLPFVATCLILLGYLLGRIRPVARWRSGRELHPVHNVQMRSLGLPADHQRREEAIVWDAAKESWVPEGLTRQQR